MRSIFNSLGSNYDKPSGAYGMFIGSKNAHKVLHSRLAHHYNKTNITLCYKGREAITLGLNQLGLPAGSYVAINGYTCFAVYQAIIAANLRPFYLDIEKDQLNFTPARLEQSLKNEPNIKAVMVQNTLGLPADIAAISKLCNTYTLPLVEDMAHSVGLLYDSGLEAGTIGNIAAFSFSQDKIIDAVCGGAVITKDPIKQPSVRPSIRIRAVTRVYPWLIGIISHTHGWGLGKVLLRIAKVLRLLPGPMSGNATPARVLPDWNASLAAKCFDRLEETVKHRQTIASIYRKNLPSKIQFEHKSGSVYLRFPIKVDKAPQLGEYLKKKGINLGTRWYDAPIAPKWLNAKTDYQVGQCPNSEWMSERMLNLPTHIHVSEDDAKYITGRVSEWLKSQ